MMAFPLILAYLVAARLVELLLAHANSRRLLAAGAVEHGRSHYPLIVALHALWIAALWIFVPHGTVPEPILLGGFVLLQLARVWIIATLGRYWTTRIISLPDAPLVRRGPYRFIRHPNYLVVALEIPVLSGAFHAWGLALAFGLANLAILYWRIRTENRALAPRRSLETRQA
jgi:methyltransferase